MKKILVALLLVAGVAGCVNPFVSDPAAAQRMAYEKRLSELDAKLVAADAAIARATAEAKTTGNADMLKAAESMAASVAAMKSERDATQKAKDGLPKAHVDVDSLLGMGEVAGGLAGVGWIFTLIKNGRKAKAVYDAALEAKESHFTAAVAGVEDFAASLTPEQKRALYDSLKRAAKAHSEDPMAMAEAVAVAKTRLRGSV